MSSGEREGRPPSTARVEAYSDGVIAIIVTIMVLELHVPTDAFAAGDFARVLTELGPKLLVYALSFVTVSIMLVNHHHLMRAAPHATNALFWWNSALLFWMSLIPLTTSVLGDSPTVPLSVAFYGAVLACTAFSFTLLHRTAACLANRNGKLGDIHRKIVVKDSYFTALYCASVPLAYVSVYAALAIFFLIPCAYFFPEFIPRLRFK